jgi:O-antigen/teichoic acid export membrane protein
VTILLARLLAPEQFGVMGYCLIGLQYLSLFNLIGVDAVISRRARVAEAANAAFFVHLATGLLLFALAWIGAPQLARFFHADAVTPLFRLLAVSIPITALGGVPEALLQRDLRFKARLIPELGRSLVKGVVSVTLALKGYGVVSLVIGQLAGEAVATVCVWLLTPWRPSMVMDRKVTWEVLGYGMHMVAVCVLGALFGNLDMIFVGRVLGAQSLGFYTLGYRIPDLLISSTNMVVGRVAFPIFSKLQVDSGQLRATYMAYIRYMSMLIFPAGVGLAIIATPLIVYIYSAKWAPSIDVMRLIAIAMAINSVGYLPGVLYKANNRPEILTKLSMVKLVHAIPILWLSTRWGIVGVACGQIVTMSINQILDAFVVSRVFGFKATGVLRSLAPAAISSAVMGAIGFAAAPVLLRHHIPGVIALVLMGAAVYLGVLAVTARQSLLQASRVLLSSRRTAEA